MIELLIAGDDPAGLHVLAMHFEYEGYVVRTAPSGEVAMSMLKLRLPRVVIVDALMHGMSGIDVCRQIRETYQDEASVILLAPDPEFEREAIDAGAASVVSKPFKLATLSGEVGRLSSSDVEHRALSVLILEDNPADAEIVLHELRKAGYETNAEVVDNEDDFRTALEQQPDLVLADYNLPEFDGLSALKIVRTSAPHIPLVIVSGAIGEDIAVEAVMAGAADYVLKDRLGRLAPAVSKALAAGDLARSRRETEEVLRQAASEIRMIMNTVTEGVLTLDEEGIIVTANLAGAAMIGRLPSELYGSRLVDLLDPNGETQGRDWLHSYLNERGDSPKPSPWHPVLALDPEGKPLSIELSASSLELELGRTTVLVMRQRPASC